MPETISTVELGSSLTLPSSLMHGEISTMLQYRPLLLGCGIMVWRARKGLGRAWFPPFHEMKRLFTIYFAAVYCWSAVSLFRRSTLLVWLYMPLFMLVPSQPASHLSYVQGCREVWKAQGQHCEIRISPSTPFRLA